MSDLASAIGIRAAEESFVAERGLGSESAFESCSSPQHVIKVYSLITWSLRDATRGLAADVTQDVFVKVFRSISGFDGRSSLRTWIYQIALREASNQRRWWSRHKQQETAIDAVIENAQGETFCLAEALAGHDASPYDCAAQSEMKQRIEAALLQLPEAFREVVVLREIEGFGYEEIAEILDVNLGTVKSRLTRGRHALREILKSEMMKAQPNAHKAALAAEVGAEV